MSKGLEALEKIEKQELWYSEAKRGILLVVDNYVDECCEIYKELKVLEIIKEKKVDADILTQSVCVQVYNKKTRNWFYKRPLTQEEFDLLKEYFK